MITGSAALNAANAALRSPLCIASSTLRMEFRSTVRSALFTSVGRAITRVALRSDLVLAIRFSFVAGAFGGHPLQGHGFANRCSRGITPPDERCFLLGTGGGVTTP